MGAQGCYSIQQRLPDKLGKLALVEEGSRFEYRHVLVGEADVDLPLRQGRSFRPATLVGR